MFLHPSCAASPHVACQAENAASASRLDLSLSRLEGVRAGREVVVVEVGQSDVVAVGIGPPHQTKKRMMRVVLPNALPGAEYVADVAPSDRSSCLVDTGPVAARARDVDRIVNGVVVVSSDQRGDPGEVEIVVALTLVEVRVVSGVVEVVIDQSNAAG